MPSVRRSSISSRSSSGRAQQRPLLVGNRMALTGAVVYLLEWVAIAGSAVVGVQQIGGDPAAPTSPDQLANLYAGTRGGLALIAGWMALVLTGRVLMMVGFRAALEASGRSHPLMGFAVHVMAVSVALEIAATGLYAGAGTLSAESSAVGVQALDRAGTAVFDCVFGSFGLSVLTAAWCLWRSGLFPRVLNVLGLAGGAGMTLMQLATAPALAGVLTALNVAILLAWIWMIWAGVLVWRRSPPRGSASPAAG